MLLNDFIKIGHVAKTHGLNGYFSIKLYLSEDLHVLFIDLKRIYLKNQSIPLIISTTSLNKKIFLTIKVNTINSREEAKLILQKNIYIKIGDHPKIDTLINKKIEFINFKVIDNIAGEIGFIEKIDFNRPQILFFVKKNNKQIFIPFVKELITNIDYKKHEIHMDLPDGLTDLCCE